MKKLFSSILAAVALLVKLASGAEKVLTPEEWIVYTNSLQVLNLSLVPDVFLAADGDQVSDDCAIGIHGYRSGHQTNPTAGVWYTNKFDRYTITEGSVSNYHYIVPRSGRWDVRYRDWAVNIDSGYTAYIRVLTNEVLAQYAATVSSYADAQVDVDINEIMKLRKGDRVCFWQFENNPTRNARFQGAEGYNAFSLFWIDDQLTNSAGQDILVAQTNWNQETGNDLEVPTTAYLDQRVSMLLGESGGTTVVSRLTDIDGHIVDLDGRLVTIDDTLNNMDGSLESMDSHVVSGLSGVTNKLEIQTAVMGEIAEDVAGIRSENASGLESQAQWDSENTGFITSGLSRVSIAVTNNTGVLGGWLDSIYSQDGMHNSDESDWWSNFVWDGENLRVMLPEDYVMNVSGSVHLDTNILATVDWLDAMISSFTEAMTGGDDILSDQMSTTLPTNGTGESDAIARAFTNGLNLGDVEGQGFDFVQGSTMSQYEADTNEYNFIDDTVSNSVQVVIARNSDWRVTLPGFSLGFFEMTNTIVFWDFEDGEHDTLAGLVAAVRLFSQWVVGLFTAIRAVKMFVGTPEPTEG